jgi:hypothetical protein
VAQHRLPFSFNVVARLPPVQAHPTTSNSSTNNSRASAPGPLPPEYTLLTGNPFPNETPFGTGLQAGDFLSMVPLQRHSEAVTSSNDHSPTNYEGLVVERNTHNYNSRAVSSSSTPSNVNEPLNRDYDETQVRYVLCATLILTPSE